MVGNVFPVLLVAGGLTAAYGFLDGGWSPCSICGDPIDVTLTAKNHFVEPYFEFSVTIQQTSQRELVSLMQEAADIDGRFKYG
ncbi:hypothetical protein BaRGS_00031258 [Batillaria attramentaria]|uniref:Uncharacterized protein n=1 Tax=Batillaria attramentaria TaxID=370345 RepID=A0ABD0JS39_9CAEN